MIIICPNCNKLFNVDSNLIPDKGRTMQCGSCNHVWFFNKSSIGQSKYEEVNFKENISEKEDIVVDKIKRNISETIKNKRNYELTKYKGKSKFTFFKFISYFIVFLVSIIAVIIIIDTFKTPLYSIFPSLEILLFNLFETLKDIELFIKDLIKS